MMDLINRSELPYSSLSQRFVISKKSYTQQFSHLYNRRITGMKQQLRNQSIGKWGEQIEIMNRIIDSEISSGTNQNATDSQEMEEDNIKEYVLIGTLYKQMPLRPSVLDEYKDSTSYHSSNTPDTANIASNNDTLLLEDETGRIALTGAIASIVGQLVTGVVIAVKGREAHLGEFEVSDWVFAAGSEMEEVSEDAHMDTEDASPGPFVLLVSGLHVGSASCPSTAIDMLVEFVAGRLGDEEDVKLASKICRVVIVGDAINVADSNTQATYKDKKQSTSLVAAAKQFDLILTQLLCCCPVLLMPGSSDPVNNTLPQQPLHPCLLPHSCRFSTLNQAPNPAYFTIGSHSFLGHAGQPIADLRRQCRQPASTDTQEKEHSSDSIPVPELNLLKNTLLWGHMCPTCPDSLPCYPFMEEDLFVIPQDAHVQIYFAGNQSEFATSLVRSHQVSNDNNTTSGLTRIISVPAFSSTNKAVLVDLSSPSLNCRSISFGL